MSKVAFIGLGIMGYPMAGHIRTKGGHDLTVYNRTLGKAQAWVAEYGGQLAPTPEEAAKDADFVFCCVGNDEDLRQVTTGEQGAFHGLKPGAIFVDSTTASANIARELYDAAASRGAHFLDAPVSGGQAGAQNGVLTVMVGGDPEPFAKAEPVIACYARAVKLLGPSGAGQLTKMVNQICIAGLVQGLSEAIHFAQKSGLDVAAVIDTHFQGRGAVLADGKPLEHHGRGQVRFRLRGGLDAQGFGDLPRRGPPQWRAPAGFGARRSVLFRGPGDGRQALGYVEPDRKAERQVA